MIAFLSVFEKYWYVSIVIVAFYLLIIVLIEIKDTKYLHFNIAVKKHEYKETKSRSRMNYLFLQDFNFYKNASIEALMLKVNNRFKKVIVLTLKDDTELDQLIRLQQFIDQLSDGELKLFLVKPETWLNRNLTHRRRFFLMYFFNKNRATTKNLLPLILRIERQLLDELKIDNIDSNLNFKSEVYNRIND